MDIEKESVVSENLTTRQRIILYLAMSVLMRLELKIELRITMLFFLTEALRITMLISLLLLAD